MLPPPPRSTLFPYTTLFRSSTHESKFLQKLRSAAACRELEARPEWDWRTLWANQSSVHPKRYVVRPGDRKSTRLSSSHVEISYAVFCLKKKKKNVKR